MARVLLTALLLCVYALGEEAAAIKILEKRCSGCHNSSTKQSGLDLTSRAMAVRGGDRGPAIQPGSAKDSMLYQVATHAAKPHMPYGSAKLSDEELKILATWIDHGADWEGKVAPAAVAVRVPKQDHWAFRLPKRVEPPHVTNAAWVRNPIDAFVAAEHDKRGLQPVAEADRTTLLRRVYLDVVGVPPTPEETARFELDKSAKAYEALVDRLLDDPRYGERWGRHWMDIWRYSDWYGWRRGNDVRNSHKHMWRFRDWIVESLNQDKGYDRMMVEMLAGDEIAPNDPKTVRATGFLARNFSKYDRNGWMQDAVDHTALGLLGVTVKCARCHDHKYDQISQEEYYKFRAFFEPYEVRIDRVPGQVDTDKEGLSRIFDAELDRPTYLLVRGDIQNPVKDKALAPAVPALFGGKLSAIQPVTLPVSSYYPDHREFVHKDLRAQAKAEVERAQAEVTKQKEAHAAAKKEAESETGDAAYQKLRGASDALTLTEKSLAAAEAALPALEARIAADSAKYSDPPDPKYEELADAARKAERKAGILKADENVFRAQLEFTQALKSEKTAEKMDDKKVAEAQKRVAAAQAALTQVAEGYTPVGKVYPTKSTGRRLALANWIASTNNPLTARVAVNHMWLRHFGQALVPTVFEFGKNGKAPTHPELLDWMATRFMDSKWSMKAIHRLILTSSTYRMRSTAGTAKNGSADIDPDNVYLWRMNPRRMEAEAVRDSILSVSGQLDSTMGGPELDETKGFETKRRSIYFSHSPDTQMEFLKTFDGANPTECYMRNVSVVPQQALALANSELSQRQARILADRLSAAGQAFVPLAFQTVLGRPASTQEAAAAERFLAANDPQARANLIHVLFNHNDFVTIR
ncbi:MAG: PSD1 domain-containing protein [Bryobacterales bacterium]|nr:PSD1 domain-containing protein [Bryobacterales bacterium]